MLFFILYQKYFYWGWLIFALIRIELNKEVFRKIDNELIKHPYSLWRLKWEENALAFFTFWWKSNNVLENIDTRSFMRKINIVNVLFIIYSIILIALFLYL